MKSGIIARALDYYLAPDKKWAFGAEVNRAIADFFESPHPSLNEDNAGHFTEWFLFDFRFSDGTTPLESFCRLNPLELPAEELKIYLAMQQNHYDFWEIANIAKDHGMTLVSVRNGKRIEVQEKTATQDAHIGDVFLCRVVNVGDHWEIASADALGLSVPSAHDRKQMQKHFPILNSKVVYHEIVLPMREDSMSLQTDDIGNGKTIVTGSFGAPQEELDDCPVCMLMKRVREEDRQPTESELQKAFDEANKHERRG